MAFCNQVIWLKGSGCHCMLLLSGAKSMLREKKCGGLTQTQRKKNAVGLTQITEKKVTVILYKHAIAHNFKRRGNRAGVHVVFSAPETLPTFCKKVNSTVAVNNNCAIRHQQPFVECAKNAYSVPLPCGWAYIGQTGRHLNERLMEYNVIRASQHTQPRLRTVQGAWSLLGKNHGT